RDRTYVLPQDVFDVAPDILRHRLVLSYEALPQGTTADQILSRLLSTIPAPRITPSQDQSAGQARVVTPASAPSAAPAPAPAPDPGRYDPNRYDWSKPTPP